MIAYLQLFFLAITLISAVCAMCATYRLMCFSSRSQTSTKPAVRYVCVRHWPVDITYTCKRVHIPVVFGGSEERPEHTHVAVQYHRSSDFQRDDISQPDILANCRGISVREEERGYYEEGHVRLVHQDGQLIVVTDGDNNSYLVGFADSHDQAMRFVALGDTAGLTLPWESRS